MEKETTIFRVQKSNKYTCISNAALQDPRLSFRATGLLAYLLSMPNDWSVNCNDLANRKLEGRDAIRKAMRELEAAGYAKFVYLSSDNGRKAGCVWMIYEEPQLAQSDTPSGEPNDPPIEESSGHREYRMTEYTSSADSGTLLNKQRQSKQLQNTHLFESNNTKEREYEGEKSKKTTTPQIPESLNTPEFIEAFDEYMAMRKQLRKGALTPVTLKRRFEEWSKWGVEKAVLALRNSVMHQWQGVWEPVLPAQRSNGRVNGHSHNQVPENLAFGWGVNPDGTSYVIEHGKIR